MNESGILQISTPLVYLVAAGLIVVGLHNRTPAVKNAGIWLALLGVVLHACALYLEVSRIGGFGADFFSSLSLVSLLIAVVLLAAAARFPVTEILPLALPGAAFMLALKAIMAPAPTPLETGSAMLDLHVIASLLAYSLLSIAALTAIFISVQHNLLRRHTGARLIEILPPLVVLETLLFRMITVGWILLSLSLATGLLFVDNLFAQHLAHKTFLSIVSWLVFGLLLAGRWRYGWRGMRVVRLCLLGMAILVLAYFGSKAVLELLLDRRWQTG
ncbi:MAG: cytochrome c biogenesis protein CcsA [Wenzhouxiangellaceae bacterium]|nr:cytochrome c biogenesis protein CcsA [Wenzhouxiangellaceae bacterium]